MDDMLVETPALTLGGEPPDRTSLAHMPAPPPAETPAKMLVGTSDQTPAGALSEPPGRTRTSPSPRRLDVSASVLRPGNTLTESVCTPACTTDAALRNPVTCPRSDRGESARRDPEPVQPRQQGEMEPAETPAQVAQPAGLVGHPSSTTTPDRRAGILAPGDREPVHIARPADHVQPDRLPDGETPAETPGRPPDGETPAQTLEHMPAQLPAGMPRGGTPTRVLVETPARLPSQMPATVLAETLAKQPVGETLAHLPAPPAVEMPAKILGGEPPDWTQDGASLLHMPAPPPVKTPAQTPLPAKMPAQTPLLVVTPAQITAGNRGFVWQFKPATTGLEKPAEYRAPQAAPEGGAQQKQDRQKQDQQKQGAPRQPTPGNRQPATGTWQQAPDTGKEPARETRDGVASPARSPATPEFATPRSSPLASPPAAGRSGAGMGTPRSTGRPVVKRRVTFNLEQGETEPQAAAEPPPQEVPPPAVPQAAAQPPARHNNRPRRVVKRPAWHNDFDMEASASTVRCCGVDESRADNSVGGVSGHVEDDYNAAVTRSTGRYETGPPEGGYSVARVAAMCRDVVQSTNRLLDILANDGGEETV